MSHLRGKRIVVTRSQEQTAVLCQKFEALGATAVSFPTIQFVPYQSDKLSQALATLPSYDWIVFTSSNGVRFFLKDLSADQLAQLQQSQVAAVGSATLKALTSAEIPVAFVPDTFTGEALATGLGDVRNQRILLPRAKVGRPEIVQLLRDAGAEVLDVPLYETVTAVPPPSAWQQLTEGIDVITFTSPSSVRNFFKIINNNRPQGFLKPLGSKSKTLIACIGPSTKAEAEQNGLTVQIMPDEYTIDGLVEAVASFFSEK